MAGNSTAIGDALGLALKSIKDSSNKDNKVIIPMFESKIKSNKKSRYGNLFSKK